MKNFKNILPALLLFVLLPYGAKSQYTLQNDDVYVINGQLLIYYAPASKPTAIIIPSILDNQTITSIGTHFGIGAFARRGLTSVTLPASLTSIGDFAFSGNQLTSVTLPSSLQSIGNSAFQNNSLTSVTLPASLTSIGNSAFEQNQLTLITLPASLIFIGAEAFVNNAGLASVTLPPPRSRNYLA